MGFILISGIPGSAKSNYGIHLRDAHGFHFIETDKDEDREFIYEAEFSNPGLVSRYLDKYRQVVVEWGFVPKCYLDYVIELKKQGAKLLWFFTAEEATARWAYCVGWEGDSIRLMLWENQIWRIREAHLPTSDFELVETFRDGRFRSNEELDQEVLRSYR